MPKRDRMSDDEIERLLSESTRDGERDLEQVLSALLRFRHPVDEEALAAHVDEVVTASLRPKSAGRDRVPVPSRRHVQILSRPALVGLLSVATLVIGLSGVAWAANGSKPGDSLYGLDRAFEVIGIGNGGSQERLSEIRALLDAGDLARMLDHVNDVLPANAAGTEGAVAALKAAAETVSDLDTTPADTMTAAMELVDYLATNLQAVDAAEITKFAGHIRARGFDPPEIGLTPADPTDPSGFREEE